MTHPLLILPLPTAGQAVLGVSQPLTPESLPELEHALAQAMEELRREVCDAATLPGELEYVSWTPLPRHCSHPSALLKEHR